MRHSSIHTVDISAESVSAYRSVPASPRNLSAAIRQSLGIDIFLIFVSLFVALLFSSAIGAVIPPVNVDTTTLHTPPQWLIFVVCALPPAVYLFLDVLSTLSNPATLPFARSKGARSAIYASRVHLMLLAFYFTAILAALCWSAWAMPLASKMFVAAIFSFALYSLGQSIPSKRMSFIVSGILFLVVLIATQAFIVMRLEADADKANQDLLNELVPPPKAAPERTDEAAP